MKGPQQIPVMLKNDCFDPPEIACPPSAISCQTDIGFQPKLALTLLGTDVDVRRFKAFIRVEMKPE